MPPKKTKATPGPSSPAISSTTSKKASTAKPSTSKAKLKTSTAPVAAIKTKPVEVDVEGLEEWEQLSKKKWRGLGLSDPVKSVEVRP